MSKQLTIQEFGLWDKMMARGVPISFHLEITARCNNDCRHCYINLPAGDATASGAELSAEDVLSIARQAVEMGAVWCVVGGGEPLLRQDFDEIYIGLKRLGLLVGVFTNACLVTPAVAELFRRYPPRDIEVSVYGATRETYEAVTRSRGSFERFMRGLSLLTESGVKLRLKAMALRSNVHEFEEIARFCREHTKDYFRFDPQLHLRYDGDQARNEEIKNERLSPEEVVAVERADDQRFRALQAGCANGELIDSELERRSGDDLFLCGAGRGSFTVGYDGTFRLCDSLCQPGTTYDLRVGTLREAWDEWVPRVRAMRSENPEYLEKCGRCSLAKLCMWCPAHAALESGALDEWVEYFCEVAHARAAAARVEDGGSSRATEASGV